MKKQHIRRRKPNALLVAAAALPAVFLAAPPARAQYQIDNTRSNDANNRLDSNGYNGNGPGINRPYGAFSGGNGNQVVTGNQIINGNVTAGREFRGFVPYTDPRAFRDGAAGSGLDRFIAGSAGAPIGNSANIDLTRPMPFYGESRGVPPPPGFVREGFNGGYVPRNPNAPITNPLDTANYANPLLPNADNARLGTTELNPNGNLPRPGQLLGAGPLDPSANPTLYAASPLFGLKQLSAGNPQDQYLLGTLRQQNSIDRLGLSDAAMRQMGSELLQPNNSLNNNLANPSLNNQPNQNLDANNPNNPNNPNPQAPGAGPNAPRPGLNSPNVQNIPGQNNPTERRAEPNVPLGAADAVSNPNLAAGPYTDRLQTSRLGADVRTGEGTRQQLLIPPSQQSTVYKDLRRKLEQYNSQRYRSDEEANRDFRALLRAKQEADKKAQPAEAQRPNEAFRPGVTRGGAPEIDAVPPPVVPGHVSAEQPTTTPPAPAVKPEPMKVESLAEGVKAEGLRNLLTKAEDLMRQGKYTSALDQYDAAEQLVPNNPLVSLGKGVAELGAGNYVRADTQIRAALAGDPALLLGQYDLRKLLGEDRVQFLVGDLKQIANTQKDQELPIFLIAFIAYNTGNAESAANYLDMADKRARGGDTLIRVLRDYWKLPDNKPESAPTTKPTTPEMNK